MDIEKIKMETKDLHHSGKSIQFLQNDVYSIVFICSGNLRVLIVANTRDLCNCEESEIKGHHLAH